MALRRINKVRAWENSAPNRLHVHRMKLQWPFYKPSQASASDQTGSARPCSRSKGRRRPSGSRVARTPGILLQASSAGSAPTAHAASRPHAGSAHPAACLPVGVRRGPSSPPTSAAESRSCPSPVAAPSPPAAARRRLRAIGSSASSVRASISAVAVCSLLWRDSVHAPRGSASVASRSRSYPSARIAARCRQSRRRRGRC